MKKVKYNGVTYKVGDRVLLVNKRPWGWNDEGQMDKYLGKVVTISKILNDKNFEIEEDDGKNVFNWIFGFEEIVKKAEGTKHFKSYPDNYTGVLNIKDGYVQEILDSEEKKYLEAVIKPFKDKVLYIKKFESTSEACISIGIKKDMSISLPNFPKDTMYNGMEIDKEYTLKELRLFEE